MDATEGYDAGAGPRELFGKERAAAVLGVSMLVETPNHRSGDAPTGSTVLGPFHLVESPRGRARRHHLDAKGPVSGLRAAEIGPSNPFPALTFDLSLSQLR